MTTPVASHLEGRARHAVATRRKVWPWVVAGVVLFLVLVVAWVGIRGLLARGELEAAVPLASSIQQQMIDGDTEGAAATLDALQGHASTARSLTSDVVWRGAEVVPWVGGNLRVVRELTEVVDDLAVEGIAPLAEAAGQLDPSSLRPVDGAIDVQPLVDAGPQVALAAGAIAAARDQMHSVRRDDVIEPLRDAADELEASIDEVATAMGALDGALRLLPPLLGADGPREYLLLFQNPAELRSSGGIPGAMALITADSGRIQLVQQAVNHDFPKFPAPVLDLPLETRSLYGDITGEYILDVTLAPQFPLAARLAREMWRQQFGAEVDGVIALDPIALSYLLEATGPVGLPTGDELNSDNAVQLLLSEVYARYPSPQEQDVFFASAAVTVFDRVANGNVDPRKLIDAFAAAGEERRILMWFNDAAEQEVLAGTTLAGELPVSDTEATRLGMYFNDATGSKMDYYLDREITVASAVCRNDGLRAVQVDLTLTNTALNDQLPEYVTGGGEFGVKPGDVHTMVALYAPPGSYNQGVSMVVDGVAETVGAHQATDSEYIVSQVTVELAPQESKTVRYSMLLGAETAEEIVVVPTPGITAPVMREVALGC